MCYMLLIDLFIQLCGRAGQNGSIFAPFGSKPTLEWPSPIVYTRNELASLAHSI